MSALTWLAALVVMAWVYSAMLLFTGRTIVRWVFWELRPFYLPAVVLLAGTYGHFTDPLADFSYASEVACWFLWKDSDGDDNRWKRRRRRVVEAVRRVGSRLAVVPAGSPT